ncbi:MAG: ribosome small subunit-dependent GTPase A [Christensenellales bacterium]|jgi:ribosome biogenesis GTPase
MRRGQILRGVGGFYDVYLPEGGEVVRTVARGRLRQKAQRPLAGDMVSVLEEKSDQGDVYGSIEEILPRKNAFVRPPVANVDQVMIVASLTEPRPDPLLIDRLLLIAGIAGVDAAVCFNKCEDVDEEYLKSWTDQYRAVDTIVASAHEALGLDALSARLEGRITCMAGQSGVGKTSLINALSPQLDLEVGDLSKKIGRGKHTTRHAELLPLPCGGYIVDTPGFSMLETENIDPLEIKDHYPEFEHYDGDCRFGYDCLHISEPGCAVKHAAQRSEISNERLARYAVLVAEAREKMRGQYD